MSIFYSIFGFGRKGIMRILCAMLGGTIASSCISGTIKLGEPSFAVEYLTKNFPGHEFVFPKFKQYSSEDATPDIYRESLRRIVNEIKACAFDGILITHGTDTCAFFAQLAARVLSAVDLPYVITGAMRSPDVDPEEAAGNLDHAVTCLEKGMSGVVFRNKEGRRQLYKAHLIMSPDINGIYSEYEEGIDIEKKDYSEFLSNISLPRILMIPAVPGAVYSAVDYDRVIICCNHSGTASSKLEMFVRIRTLEGIPCFMAPVPAGGGVYESRKRLRDAGAVELPGTPIEGAWAEVLLR